MQRLPYLEVDECKCRQKSISRLSVVVLLNTNRGMCPTAGNTKSKKRSRIARSWCFGEAGYSQVVQKLLQMTLGPGRETVLLILR